MKPTASLIPLAFSSILLTGCITEPAEDVPTVYGHVSKDPKVRKSTAPKPREASAAPLIEVRPGHG